LIYLIDHQPIISPSSMLSFLLDPSDQKLITPETKPRDPPINKADLTA